MFDEIVAEAKGDQKLMLRFISTLTGVSKIQAKRVITTMARYVLIQLIKSQKVEISHLGVFRIHNSRVVFEPCAEIKRFLSEYAPKQRTDAKQIRDITFELSNRLLDEAEVEHAHGTD